MKPLFLLFFIALLSCSQREILEDSIPWERDYEVALNKAREEGKPVFIYFSARWCSWCREYEKILSKKIISEYIRNNFIPLFLLVEEERKLFREFGGRGTPFTIVLNPRGQILLRFHGILPEEELLGLLSAPGLTPILSGEEQYKIEDLSEAYRFLLSYFLEDLQQRYDPLLGGFSAPGKAGYPFKWPTPLTYRFLLSKNLLVEEVIHSIDKDIEHLYDPVDGGFFNFYDRTRAYTQYFETSKSLKVNAGMILALTKAYEKTGKKHYLSLAMDTYTYLKRFLYHPDSGCFLNAQVSSPEYYNLPPEERKKKEPPPPDRYIVVEDNALLIFALRELYKFHKNDEILDTASRCLEFLTKELFDGKRLFGFYDVKEKRKGLPNYERDIAFLFFILSSFPQHRDTALKIASLKEKYRDILSASLAVIGYSNLGKKKPELLQGKSVPLNYHNPDDITFLLRALEVLTGEKDDKAPLP
ncbi:thioredoxin family protein [Aquifex sp.]